MRLARRPLIALLLAAPLLASLPAFAAAPAGPPVARVVETKRIYNGKEYVDPYAWLRERGSKEVLAYLEAENAWTEHFMAPTAGQQKALYDEMVGRIKEDDTSVPVKIDDRFYYTREEKGKQYPIYCRKTGSEAGSEEILLDVNELAKGLPFLRIGVFHVAPNHAALAYSIDLKGDERYELHFKDLATGRILPEAIPDTTYSAAWSADSSTLYYTTLDASSRSYKLFRHRLGDDPKKDAELYHETDEAYNVGIEKTVDRKILLRESASQVTTEVAWAPTDAADPVFQVIYPRTKEVEYSVEHRGDEWFVMTNENARNFKVVRVAVADPDKAKWVEVVPHDPDVKLDEFHVFAGHLALIDRRDGLLRVRVVDLATGASHLVDLPETVSTPGSGDNPNFDTTRFRIEYSSLVTPHSVYDYDMATRALTLLKRQEIPSGYDRDSFATERITAVSEGGATVPVCLVYKKSVPRDGSAPCYLYGYGAYGITMDPEFSFARQSILERGFVYACAQVRGGSDKGRAWYDDGKFLKKRNTFLDFAAAGETLVKGKYTSSARLAISGGSAGGLLVGATVTMRPELFGAVIADVPFVDIVNTMMDPSLPLTIGEYEEWGDPNDPVYFDYMLSYSPYDNVKKANYPAMLVTGGLNDPRVSYWEPAKFVAKLRVAQTGSAPILLRTKMGEGHAGASGRYDYLKDLAFEYAFLIRQFGVK